MNPKNLYMRTMEGVDSKDFVAWPPNFADELSFSVQETITYFL